MVDDPFTFAPLAVLGLLLLYAAISDLRSRSVDNWVSIAMAAAAPVWWLAAGWSAHAMAWQVGFAAIVFAVLFGAWMLKVLGGADVKLIAALALWLPAGERLSIFFAIAVAGAVVAVTAGVWALTLRRRGPKPIEVPYALAIAAGGAVFLLRTIN